MLLRNVPDVLRAYKLMDSAHPDIPANVNAFVHHESDMVMHDVKDKNNVETDNVIVTCYHHDRANETLLRGARRDGQANVLPPYTEHPTETDSVVESYDDSAVATRNCDPSFINTTLVLSDSRSFTFAEWTLRDMPLPFATR